MNIKDALLYREGSLAGMLALADSYIKGEWGEFRNWVKKLQVTEEKIPPLYADACLRSDGRHDPLNSKGETLSDHALKF